MAWVLSTVQSISLEEGAPELPGFFLGQSESSPAMTLVFEDTKTAEALSRRKRGTPNKAASARVEKLVAQGRKLPHEELVELFYYCRSQAARYQPEVIDEKTHERVPNKDADAAEHGRWVDRAREAARDAAPYYASKRASVAVVGSLSIDDQRRGDPREDLLAIWTQMFKRGQVSGKTIDVPKLNGPPAEPVEDAVIVTESNEDSADGELA